MASEHQLTDAFDVRAFILAGNARFTLVSRKTGHRYTYRARRPEDDKPTFVSLLTGPDNEASYDFLGTIFKDGSYRHGMRSTIRQDSEPAQAFEWLWNKLGILELPKSVEFWHEGRCGRCGRTLTVPESIATGFGPECVQFQRHIRMGNTQPELHL